LQEHTEARNGFSFGAVQNKSSRGRQTTIPARAEDTFIDGLEDEDIYEDMVNLGEQTPSRGRLPALAPAQYTALPEASYQSLTKQKNIDFGSGRQSNAPGFLPQRGSSPLDLSLNQAPIEQSKIAPPADLGNSLSRHTYYKQQVDAIAPTPEQHPVPLMNETVKISGTQEISDTDQPAENTDHASTSAKRPHADLDYDLENLYSKSYADLAQETFLKDPRMPPAPPQIDNFANPMTLPQRLARLSSLDQQGQATLFRSLTDAENEEVGQWFLNSLQEDLKKLMERRLERRKISLRYEMEVQKREAAVQRKRADVEGELNELKSGGGKLIEGRSAERVGTPRGK
jgi:hypothetical protein